jgi:hypothetical protein
MLWFRVDWLWTADGTDVTLVGTAVVDANREPPTVRYWDEHPGDFWTSSAPGGAKREMNRIALTQGSDWDAAWNAVGVRAVHSPAAEVLHRAVADTFNAPRVPWEAVNRYGGVLALLAQCVAWRVGTDRMDLVTGAVAHWFRTRPRSASVPAPRVLLLHWLRRILNARDYERLVAPTSGITFGGTCLLCPQPNRFARALCVAHCREPIDGNGMDDVLQDPLPLWFPPTFAAYADTRHAVVAALQSMGLWDDLAVIRRPAGGRGRATAPARPPPPRRRGGRSGERTGRRDRRHGARHRAHEVHLVHGGPRGHHHQTDRRGVAAPLVPVQPGSVGRQQHDTDPTGTAGGGARSHPGQHHRLLGAKDAPHVAGIQLEHAHRDDGDRSTRTASCPLPPPIPPTSVVTVAPYESNGEMTGHRTLLLVDTHRREAQFWDPSSGETYYRERFPGPLLRRPIPELLADAERATMWRDMDLRFVQLQCSRRGLQDVIEEDETDEEVITGLCVATSLLMYCVCLRANVTDLCTVNATLLQWAERFQRQGTLRRLRLALALWFVQCNKASSPYRLASWIGLRTDPAYPAPTACHVCDRGPGPRRSSGAGATREAPRARQRIELRRAADAGLDRLPDAPRRHIPR